jgi:hypothetical protein
MATTPELFKYFCRTCHTHICTYINEWIEITKTYSTFENAISYMGFEIVVLDEERSGYKDSELEGCTLQPLSCKRCRKIVGSICVWAPEGKEQYK